MKVTAATYYLDSKGKIVREKVDNDQVFDEDIDNRINRKRFTFPNVKEGYVVEYKYEMVSTKSYRIIDWDFQHFIPVKHSQFDVAYPKYFTYLSKYQGKLPSGYDLENNAAYTKSFSSDFGSYDVCISPLSGEQQLLYVRNFRLDRFMKPPESYPAFRDVLKKVSKADKFQIVIKEREGIIVEK